MQYLAAYIEENGIMLNVMTLPLCIAHCVWSNSGVNSIFCINNARPCYTIQRGMTWTIVFSTYN